MVISMREILVKFRKQSDYDIDLCEFRKFWKFNELLFTICKDTFCQKIFLYYHDADYEDNPDVIVIKIDTLFSPISDPIWIWSGNNMSLENISIDISYNGIFLGIFEENGINMSIPLLQNTEVSLVRIDNNEIETMDLKKFISPFYKSNEEDL